MKVVLVDLKKIKEDLNKINKIEIKDKAEKSNSGLIKVEETTVELDDSSENSLESRETAKLVTVKS